MFTYNPFADVTLTEAKAPKFGEDWPAHAACKSYEHHDSHCMKHELEADKHMNKADEHSEKAESHFWHAMHTSSSLDSLKHKNKMLEHMQLHAKHVDLEKHHAQWSKLHDNVARKLQHEREKATS